MHKETRIRPNVEALSAYVPGEQPTDPRVIKLNTNENPYPPSPHVGRVCAAMAAATLRLYPDPACRSLREAIARLHRCAPEQVLCGNGSDEVLALCIRAFVPNHGRIGYFDPSYSLYPVLAAVADVGVEPVPLREDFTCPPLESRYDVPLFFWTNPNAPTGVQAAPAMIAEYAERSEGVIVIDEAYADFAETNCIALAREMDNVLVTRTFSKSYSLAGIRLGYVVGSEALIQALFKIKDAYNVNRMTQEIGRAAIADQAHMQENAARIIATRHRVRTALRQQGYEVLPSQTNFLWVRPPAPHQAEAIFQYWRTQGLYVRYFAGQKTGEHLRITIGTDAEMDQLLVHAARALCP